MVETLLASDWGFSLHRVKDFLRVAKNPIKIDPKMAPKSNVMAPNPTVVAPKSHIVAPNSGVGAQKCNIVA